MYWLNSTIPSNYFVHHIDGNKLNASKSNLSLIFVSAHQSLHNKNKILSEKQKAKISESNHNRKGKRMKYKRLISAKQVYDLKNKIIVLIKYLITKGRRNNGKIHRC